MSEGLKTLKLLFKSLFVLANVLIVVLFVISAYSDRVSPDTILSFSYLGLVFPILCVLNLCFILYWLFLWEWRFLLIGLCSILICWGPVKKHFPYHSRTKDPERRKEHFSDRRRSRKRTGRCTKDCRALWRSRSGRDPCN